MIAKMSFAGWTVRIYAGWCSFYAKDGIVTFGPITAVRWI